MNHLFRTTRALALALVLTALPGILAGAATNPADSGAEDGGAGLLKLGASLTERGEYQAAEISFRHVFEDPAMPAQAQQTALLSLARMYRKSGDPTKAAAIYEKFIKEFPSDERLPDAYLELGRTLRSMGANKLALNRFYSVINSTLKLSATGFEHYQSLARTAEYEIAETYYENGDFAKAGSYFSRLQLLNLSSADRARASFMAAHSQILAEDLETGCKSLHVYLETWPDDEHVPEARYLLASTLRRMKRPQEALTAVLDLLKEEKTKVGKDTQVWIYWQRRTGNLLANDFFQNGDTLSALTIYQGMIALSSEPDWQLPILYQVGLCYERLLNFEGASAAYRKIVDTAHAVKGDPKPEIADLAQMASWRLNHVEWLQSTDAKLAPYASIPDNPEPAAKAPAASKPAPEATP